MTLWERIKGYLGLVAAATVAILSALLLRQVRKTDNAESELALEKANEGIKENDHDKEIAKQNADALVKSYDELKSEYDKSRRP